MYLNHVQDACIHRTASHATEKLLAMASNLARCAPLLQDTHLCKIRTSFVTPKNINHLFFWHPYTTRHSECDRWIWHSRRTCCRIVPVQKIWSKHHPQNDVKCSDFKRTSQSCIFECHHGVPAGIWVTNWDWNMYQLFLQSHRTPAPAKSAAHSCSWKELQVFLQEFPAKSSDNTFKCRLMPQL